MFSFTMILLFVRVALCVCDYSMVLNQSSMKIIQEIQTNQVFCLNVTKPNALVLVNSIDTDLVPHTVVPETNQEIVSFEIKYNLKLQGLYFGPLIGYVEIIANKDINLTLGAAIKDPLCSTFSVSSISDDFFGVAPKSKFDERENECYFNSLIQNTTYNIILSPNNNNDTAVLEFSNGTLEIFDPGTTNSVFLEESDSLIVEAMGRSLNAMIFVKSRSSRETFESKYFFSENEATPFFIMFEDLEIEVPNWHKTLKIALIVVCTLLGIALLTGIISSVVFFIKNRKGDDNNDANNHIEANNTASASPMEVESAESENIRQLESPLV